MLDWFPRMYTYNLFYRYQQAPLWHWWGLRSRSRQRLWRCLQHCTRRKLHSGSILLHSPCSRQCPIFCDCLSWPDSGLLIIFLIPLVLISLVNMSYYMRPNIHTPTFFETSFWLEASQRQYRSVRTWSLEGMYFVKESFYSIIYQHSCPFESSLEFHFTHKYPEHRWHLDFAGTFCSVIGLCHSSWSR